MTRYYFFFFVHRLLSLKNFTLKRESEKRKKKEERVQVLLVLVVFSFLLLIENYPEERFSEPKRIILQNLLCTRIRKYKKESEFKQDIQCLISYRHAIRALPRML